MFIKGMDVSTLLEVEQLGAKFYDNGVEKDCFEILKSYDINYIRLRMWNDPKSEKGEAYGAGNNDIHVTTELAKRALAHKMGFLLDFHYSDFWTDPGKQFKPKAWEGMSVKELEQAVCDYTATTLHTLKAAGVMPTMVQIGNEITNGLLWPEGQLPNYDNVAKFVNAGIKGVRQIDSEVPIMIHLDNGGNQELYRDWFDHYMERGLDFQYIGLSYYPFWHGTLKELEANMRMVAQRYKKELIVAEVSMGYTMEDYASYEKLSPDERKGMATKPELVAKIEYPMTKQGQVDFMQDFLHRIASVPGGKGFFYWEPAWIPIAGSGWATKASLEYMHEEGKTGNEWANQALFDYDGNALPTLELIKKFSI